jgi:hypothetical protein
MLNERGDHFTERSGVLLAQIDLILRASEPEPHSLIRRAAVKIVFQRDSYSPGHPILPKIIGRVHRAHASAGGHGRNAADHIQDSEKAISRQRLVPGKALPTAIIAEASRFAIGRRQ